MRESSRGLKTALGVHFVITETSVADAFVYVEIRRVAALVPLASGPGFRSTRTDKVRQGALTGSERDCI